MFRSHRTKPSNHTQRTLHCHSPPSYHRITTQGRACKPPHPPSRVQLRLVNLTTTRQSPTLPVMPPKRQFPVIGLFLWLVGSSTAFKAPTKLQGSSHIQRLPSMCTHHHGPPLVLGHLHQQDFRDKHRFRENNPGDAPFLDLSGSPSSSVPDSFLSWLDLLIPGSCFALALVALCLVDMAVMDCWPAPANAVAVGGALIDVPVVKELDFSAILQKAGRKAIGGGVSGAAASLVQLVTLMWLRTTMQFQYRYGFSFKESLVKLYKEGGLPRFYRGLPVAALQLPLSRFGDVAANAFMLLALDSFDSTRGLPLPVKSVFGSVAAGAFRFVLMPLDAVKTSLQVQGSKGWPQVKARLQEEGVSSLYQGAVIQAVATFVGHWPFFVTFNYLSSVISFPPADAVFLRLGRNAILGLCSSTVSDVCSNSFRVIKTTKQTSESQITYREALRQVLNQDGVKGLFGRGLQTRLAANALQGMMFSVVWRYLEESQILFGGK